MPNYRREWCKSGTYFFTVNLLQRQNNNLLTKHIDLLREVVFSVKQRYPSLIRPIYSADWAGVKNRD